MNAGFARRSILVLGLIGMVCQGCYSVKALPSVEAPAVIAAIGSGDRIWVRESNGRRLRVHVTALGHDYIVGSVGGTEMRIELADVLEIERRVPAPGKTVALMTGAAAFFLAASYMERNLVLLGP